MRPSTIPLQHSLVSSWSAFRGHLGWPSPGAAGATSPVLTRTIRALGSWWRCTASPWLWWMTSSAWSMSRFTTRRTLSWRFWSLGFRVSGLGFRV
ncbi:unnamed protein product [Symbiodinium natans]|uniref:Uncharacterized protein n=1 Tax=Symbiodinium natans TaxID=878477 RepID=A0A812NI89_9DINO|nr:unnamed protein product [Symbiodinium natans]